MEVVACEVDGIHFGVGHLDASGIGVLIEFAANLQTSLRCRCGDQLDDDLMADERFAAQLPVMNENMRCSILFHLLVPGGK